LIIRINKEDALIPKSVNSQLEYKYALKRISYFSYLPFTKPEKNQQVYDFTINGVKIQEKVASKRNNRNAYCCGLYKNGGKLLSNKTSISYEKGDNDFYWIHIPDYEYFLILPEKILIERGYINKYNSKRHSLSIPGVISKEHWLSQYIYSYDHLCKPNICALFNIDV